MNIVPTKISEVLQIQPQVFADNRGFFLNPIITKNLQIKQV
jgi:dTDP-4-dehydrorhamnose 3,5-epimerase-like enzyme